VILSFPNAPTNPVSQARINNVDLKIRPNAFISLRIKGAARDGCESRNPRFSSASQKTNSFSDASI
jgi:hypothetical protein